MYIVWISKLYFSYDICYTVLLFTLIGKFEYSTNNVNAYLYSLTRLVTTVSTLELPLQLDCRREGENNNKIVGLYLEINGPR